MPKAKIAPRQKSAFRRLEVAVVHLMNARGEVEAARRDLSSVIGAPSHELVDLTAKIERCLRNIRMYAADAGAQCELDHDPTPQELRIGHGPHHGCGKVSR